MYLVNKSIEPCNLLKRRKLVKLALYVRPCLIFFDRTFLLQFSQKQIVKNTKIEDNFPNQEDLNQWIDFTVKIWQRTIIILRNDSIVLLFLLYKANTKIFLGFHFDKSVIINLVIWFPERSSILLVYQTGRPKIM